VYLNQQKIIEIAKSVPKQRDKPDWRREKRMKRAKKA